MSKEIDVDTPNIVEQGLDTILAHLQTPVFPRTISTHATKNAQVLVFDKRSVLGLFKTASYMDCRINSYACNTSFKGINRISPSFFMCDLDLKNFNYSTKRLNKALDATLTKLQFKMSVHPTILWTGGGYHVYQPVDGFILEDYDVFAEFDQSQLDLTSKFMRFAEAYFTNGKYDLNHNPTTKSCLVRVPNTFNSKYQGENSKVKIIQKWDGNRPKINWILRDFRRYLIQEKFNSKIKEVRTKTHSTNMAKKETDTKVTWIEKLLETPIDDYRKNAVNLILAPYLINIKRLAVGEATTVIITWLNKCRSLRHLDPNFDHIVKYALRRSLSSGYKPLRLDNLRLRNKALYDLTSRT